MSDLNITAQVLEDGIYIRATHPEELSIICNWCTPYIEFFNGDETRRRHLELGGCLRQQNT